MSAVDWLNEVGENDALSVRKMDAARVMRDARARDSWVEGPSRFGRSSRFGQRRSFRFEILFDAKRRIEIFLTRIFYPNLCYNLDDEKEDI